MHVPRVQKVPRYSANFHTHGLDKRGSLERLPISRTPALSTPGVISLVVLFYMLDDCKAAQRSSRTSCFHVPNQLDAGRKVVCYHYWLTIL